MEVQQPLFCLVDASSFVFRAYYAIRALSNSKGIPTNATFGFMNMILKVLESMQPKYIAVVFDTKEPSFRHKLYQDYKANRGVMPEDLVPQMPHIKNFIKTLGLPCLEMAGYEADDIIATLATIASDQKHHCEVCIVSSDKDLMQLVNKKVYLYDTMKDAKYDESGVQQKMGVPPYQVLDFLSLVGDSSDNIPGVKGIGPKTAVNLLTEYDSLEGIYENIDQIKKSKVKENLVEFQSNAYLSRKLAALVTDLNFSVQLDDYLCKPTNTQELQSLFTELELNKVSERVNTLVSGGAAVATIRDDVKSALGDQIVAKIPKYICIDNVRDLKKVFQSLDKAKVVALDTETTGLDLRTADLVGFSFCCQENRSYYVPIAHTEGRNIDKKSALNLLSDFLQNRSVVGQNIKFDLNILASQGVQIPNICFDTMLASFVLDSESRHSLDQLALKYFDHQNISYEDLCGKGKKHISFADLPINDATPYAAEDAFVTWHLYKKQKAELEEHRSLLKVFEAIDLPLIPILAAMEQTGICIDSQHLGELSISFAQQVEELEKQAYELAEEEFNLASPKQLQEILFEKLKLKPIKKTKTGYSTNVDVLKRLENQHPLPAVILLHREVTKLKSTYVDVLPKLADEEGRVHTCFQQTGAATGRLSSTDPNLQNIPIRTELGKKIREAFIPKEGWFLLGADYSQIELRILAQMSEDHVLQKAFLEGRDIHTDTAEQIFGNNNGKISADDRRKAKAINFGLIYGKGAFSLAEELGISRTEASEIIKNYFAVYPRVKQFLDQLPENAKAKGYAETWFGRRRPIAGIQSQNKIIFNAASRVAMNSPLQGTAADLIKIAMISINKKLQETKLKGRMLLQVHDELLFEAPEQEIEELSQIIRKYMETAGQTKGFPSFTVPLIAEVGVGKDWLRLK